MKQIVWKTNWQGVWKECKLKVQKKVN